MTYPNPTHEEAPPSGSVASPTPPDALSDGPVSAESIMPADEDVTLDQSGRPLGPRAMRTRARILEATVSILEEKSMRDLRVIDIARRIGSSPATFYQYFKDVNDVVLELATDVSETTPEMIDLIKGDWTGEAGYQRGIRLANLVIDYWDQYRPILRVRNNAADEGDPAFMEVRRKAMFPMVFAFAEAIRAAHGETEVDPTEEWDGGPIRPLSGAMFMFTSLEAMAIHHKIFSKRFGPMGEESQQIIETVATLLQSTLTSKR